MKTLEIAVRELNAHITTQKEATIEVFELISEIETAEAELMLKDEFANLKPAEVRKGWLKTQLASLHEKLIKADVRKKNAEFDVEIAKNDYRCVKYTILASQPVV